LRQDDDPTAERAYNNKMAFNGKGVTMRYVYVFALLLLTGCGISSTIVSHGGDNYMVSVDDMAGTNGFGTLHARAASDAEVHCSKQGKTMRAVSTSNTGVPWTSSTNTNLVFTCDKR
jgi:hypothetical protein